jgi:hypothetical protein
MINSIRDIIIATNFVTSMSKSILCSIVDDVCDSLSDLGNNYQTVTLDTRSLELANSTIYNFIYYAAIPNQSLVNIDCIIDLNFVTIINSKNNELLTDNCLSNNINKATLLVILKYFNNLLQKKQLIVENFYFTINVNVEYNTNILLLQEICNFIIDSKICVKNMYIILKDVYFLHYISQTLLNFITHLKISQPYIIYNSATCEHWNETLIPENKFLKKVYWFCTDLPDNYDSKIIITTLFNLVKNNIYTKTKILGSIHTLSYDSNLNLTTYNNVISTCIKFMTNNYTVVVEIDSASELVLRSKNLQFSAYYVKNNYCHIIENFLNKMTNLENLMYTIPQNYLANNKLLHYIKTRPTIKNLRLCQNYDDNVEIMRTNINNCLSMDLYSFGYVVPYDIIINTDQIFLQLLLDTKVIDIKFTNIYFSLVLDSYILNKFKEKYHAGCNMKKRLNMLITDARDPNNVSSNCENVYFNCGLRNSEPFDDHFE